MPVRNFARLLVGVSAAVAVLGMAVSAEAQEKKIKIGVIFDLTGPLAGGGSELQYTGVKIMLDHYAKTGVEGYKIETVYADAQSKPDIAINEAVRLLEQEKVDMLMGFFSSAQCVPVSARVDQMKKFMWITTCISSGVFDNKGYKYVFRPQAAGDQYGMMTTDFIAQYSKSKFGKEPKDLRVAIIHEDGAYGVDVSKGNEAGVKKAGFNLVLKEGYSATAPDLSALVTKLKRAKPDVIFHTGYNPDITLLFRQAREQGLKFGAIVGHGAGYGVYEKLKEGLGTAANYLFNTDPISIWLANQKTMDPKLPPVIKMVGEELRSVPPMSASAPRMPMSSSTTCCRARSRNMAASIPRRCARRRSIRIFPRAAPCSALASSSLARVPRWPARTSARSRWCYSTSTTNPMSCGRRARCNARPCCLCRRGPRSATSRPSLTGQG